MGGTESVRENGEDRPRLRRVVGVDYNPIVGEPGEGVRTERPRAAEGAQTLLTHPGERAQTRAAARGGPALNRVFKLATTTDRCELVDAPPCGGRPLQDPELSHPVGGYGCRGGGGNGSMAPRMSSESQERGPSSGA